MGGLAVHQEQVAREVQRIEAIDKSAFASRVDWAFAVLGLSQQRDFSSVQKAHRAVMKKLHPDKAEQTQSVARALDLHVEAKRICERTLLELEPPNLPTNLRVDVVSTTMGKRRFKLSWAAPEGQPVDRYSVGVQDAASARV